MLTLKENGSFILLLNNHNMYMCTVCIYYSLHSSPQPPHASRLELRLDPQPHFLFRTDFVTICF